MGWILKLIDANRRNSIDWAQDRDYSRSLLSGALDLSFLYLFYNRDYFQTLPSGPSSLPLYVSLNLKEEDDWPIAPETGVDIANFSVQNHLSF